VGGEIESIDGRPMGCVVGEDKRSWFLADGRSARKAAEGQKWRWAVDCEAEAPSPPTATCTGGPASDSETTLPSQSPEPSPISSQGSWPWPSPVASPLLLPTPSVPLPGLSELEEVASEAPLRLPPGVAAAGPCEGRGHDGRLAECTVLGACDRLPLRAVLRALPVCRDWAAALVGYAPLALPPPQADALLQFCLLEVLIAFDDARLPLPMSAVYSEMRAAARRACASPAVRAHLEDSIFRRLGAACKSQQEQFLREGRPHHVAWSADFKGSGFRTLERLAKHFDSERLIEVFHQRWHKRIHHSFNTRTCMEWLLTKVNRRHPLFVQHELWSRGLREAKP